MVDIIEIKLAPGDHKIIFLESGCNPVWNHSELVGGRNQT